MAGFSIYNFNDYVITLNGIIFEGFADGTALSGVPESDVFNDTVGIDGRVVRTLSNDNRWTWTVSVMQTSATNAYLSALLNVDVNTPGGAGVGAFVVKNLSGVETFVGMQAWIKRYPDFNLEANATTRNWIIRVAQGVLTFS